MVVLAFPLQGLLGLWLKRSPAHPQSFSYAWCRLPGPGPPLLAVSGGSSRVQESSLGAKPSPLIPPLFWWGLMAASFRSLESFLQAL